jgi:hypothetical protein
MKTIIPVIIVVLSIALVSFSIHKDVEDCVDKGNDRELCERLLMR